METRASGITDDPLNSLWVMPVRGVPRDRSAAWIARARTGEEPGCGKVYLGLAQLSEITLVSHRAVGYSSQIRYREFAL